MKTRQKRKNRKLFSLLLWLLCISFPLSADDLVEDAGVLEREGKSEEARALYIKWLSRPESAVSERFGRILVHTLRMPAPLEEDLDLIERHLDRLGPGGDRDQVLETAVILTELSGHHSLKKKYLDLLSPDRASSRDSAVLRLKKLPDTKYGILEHLESVPPTALPGEIDKIHNRYPDFMFQADWLYALQRLLSQRGYPEKAEDYALRLRESFPYSIEVSLLDGEVILLSGPEAYLDGSAAETQDNTEDWSGDDEGSGGDTGSAPGESLFYQAGAFRSSENAESLEKSLEQAGLNASIRRDGSTYRVIVESRDDAALDILESMDISAFRIAP